MKLLFKFIYISSLFFVLFIFPSDHPASFGVAGSKTTPESSIPTTSFDALQSRTVYLHSRMHELVNELRDDPKAHQKIACAAQELATIQISIDRLTGVSYTGTQSPIYSHNLSLKFHGQILDALQKTYQNQKKTYSENKDNIAQ